MRGYSCRKSTSHNKHSFCFIFRILLISLNSMSKGNVGILILVAVGAVAYWNLKSEIGDLEKRNAELEASGSAAVEASGKPQGQTRQTSSSGGASVTVTYDESNAAAALAEQQSRLKALKNYNASQSKLCIPGSSSYKHINDSIVRCGCEYRSYQHSRDGSTVCTGGRYDSYQHSRDGSDVACGFQYSSYQHSRDGTRVCAGGRYASYQHSRDGTRVACGGQYTSYQKSRDGSMTCYGGRYRR